MAGLPESEGSTQMATQESKEEQKEDEVRAESNEIVAAGSSESKEAVKATMQPRSRWPVHEASFYTPRRPTANKLLAKTWDEQSQRLHEHKLKHTSASVDNKPPAALPHLKQNAKGQQLAQERNARIDRDNQILEQKLQRIQRRRNTKLVASRARARTHSCERERANDSDEQAVGGRAQADGNHGDSNNDAEHEKSVSAQNSPRTAVTASEKRFSESMKFGEASEPFSLNAPAKRAAERRIREENRAIEARIRAQHSKRSHLSPLDLKKDWQNTMQYRRIASKHNLQPPKEILAHA